MLHKALPESYNRNVFVEKKETVFRHFYEMAKVWRGFAA
jgi:type I restriction enzyme R subunit